jgi:heme/copper-type cytochrome/quinol oxidase subunit 2
MSTLPPPLDHALRLISEGLNMFFTLLFIAALILVAVFIACIFAERSIELDSSSPSRRISYSSAHR